MAVLKSQIVLGNFVQSFIDFLFFLYFHTKEEKSLKSFLFFWKKNSYHWHVTIVKIVPET